MRSLVILLLLTSAAAAAGENPNRVVLRAEGAGPEVRRAVVDLLRSRLARFGLAGEVRADREGLVRVSLPPLGPDQPARVLRLLTSPGRVDIVALGDDSVVVPAEAVRGLATSLEGESIRFRIRIRGEARETWLAAPPHLVFRWDGRAVLFFRKNEGASPVVTFPPAYPREELRALFCSVEIGPLPAALEVVEKSFDAISDPALAWKRLVADWTENPAPVPATLSFRRATDGAVYHASTGRIVRDGRTAYLLQDRLFVPGHPESTVRTRIVCALDWSLLEGRITTGGVDVDLVPAEVFLAPGVALRVAPLLPARAGASFGPAGRLRVRAGEREGAVVVLSPTRPKRITVADGAVASFLLDEEGEEFLPAK